MKERAIRESSKALEAAEEDGIELVEMKKQSMDGNDPQMADPPWKRQRVRGNEKGKNKDAMAEVAEKNPSQEEGRKMSYEKEAEEPEHYERDGENDEGGER